MINVQMRSLDEVRALLGLDAERYSDEQLYQLRETTYRIAETLLEEHAARRRRLREGEHRE